MKLTVYDLGAKPDPAEIVSQSASVKRVKSTFAAVRKGHSQPDPDSRKRKCMAAGLNPNAATTYRYRHPETEMTDEEIIQHLVSVRDTKSMAQIAREHGIKPSTLKHRVLRGMSLDEALSKPVKTQYGRRA